MSVTPYLALNHLLSTKKFMGMGADNIAKQAVNGAQKSAPQFGLKMIKQPSNATYANASVGFISQRRMLRDTTPGSLKTTGDPLHVGIVGKGYLMVQAQTPQGEQVFFTRNGSLKVDPNTRQLSTILGDPVLDEGQQPIQLPENLDPEKLSISPQGQILLDGELLATLGHVRFTKEGEQQMLEIDGGYFKTDLVPLPPIDDEGKRLVTIQHRALENPNTSTLTEMNEFMQHKGQHEMMTGIVSEHYKQLATNLGRMVDIK